jgi:hypothetical protein
MSYNSAGIQLILSGICAVLVAGVLSPLPWVAKESIFEFTARQPQN